MDASYRTNLGNLWVDGPPPRQPGAVKKLAVSRRAAGGRTAPPVYWMINARLTGDRGIRRRGPDWQRRWFLTDRSDREEVGSNFIQGGFWEEVRGGGFRQRLWRRVCRGGRGAGGISVVKYLSSQALLGTGR